MNSQPPGASSTTTTSITLAQWVPTFLRWYPLRHAVVVGASQQALKHLNAAPQALTVFKAHAPKAKASPHGPNSFDWLIAAQNGPATLYQASLPSESGLLPPSLLKACWPGIQCVGQHELQARTLDAALQAAHPQAAPNWLWVGSVPAAPVLAGATQLLQQAEVVAVRVTLHPEAAAHAGLETVQALLAAQGLVLCGIEPERNPQLGTALFVRDHASAHAQTRQQLSASGQAHAQLQFKLDAESEALKAEVKAKTETMVQRDALGKDKAELQSQLQAETQGRQAEAAAKAVMQRERDELAKAHAQLQAKLDAESQALQAEVKAKTETLAQREELTKDKAELLGKLQAETQGRQAEAAAKAALQQERDDLVKAQAQLQAKLDAESQALQAEAKAKAELMAQREVLAKAKTELQAQLAAETQAKQTEATAKAEAQKQRDELAKAKADLQSQLNAETQAKQTEATAKAEAQKQRDELAKAKTELQAQLAAETQAKQAEATAKAEAQKQRDELAKAKADLQAQLNAETQAKQTEATAKAEAQKQAQSQSLSIQAELDTLKKIKDDWIESNKNPYAHNRVLTSSLNAGLRDFANKNLGLQYIKASYLDYLAIKTQQVEKNCIGRLATTVQDAVTRQLVIECLSDEKTHILEIGALYGVGMAILYNHAITRAQDVKLICLDPFDGYYGKAVDALLNQPVNDLSFRRNMKLANVSESDYSIIKRYSTDPLALQEVQKHSFNLLIIDGDHSYEGVKFDFEVFFPLLDQGGYVIFDDYNAKEWPGVQKFIDEDLKDHANLQYLGAFSRTAVGRKTY